jgi:hypothetical protein
MPDVCDVVTVDQRTPAWFAVRCGRLTGTAVRDMRATIKTGEAAARRDLRIRLVVERLTGVTQDQNGYQSADMKWGIEHEADARRAYEAHTGLLVQPIGFLAHRELLAGCSPDGVIGACAGAVEIKCPKSATHLVALRTRAIPPEYRPQVDHLLWLTGAPWADFVSFDPRFPAPGRLVIVRATLSEVERRAYEITVRSFLAEVDRELADVRQLLTPEGMVAR